MPPFLLTAIPAWGKYLAAGLLLLAVAAFTGFKVYTYEHDKLVTFQAQVQAQAANQAANAKRIEVQQQAVTDEQGTAYVQDIADLQRYYSNRLQQSKSSGGNVSAVPKPPTTINGIPTNCLPLAEQSAETTQQLIDLQNWVRNEASASK